MHEQIEGTTAADDVTSSKQNCKPRQCLTKRAIGKGVGGSGDAYAG